MVGIYLFQAEVASRGYHVFKETTWGHSSVGDRVIVDVERNQTSIIIDPYSCVIKNNDDVVGHIPGEISRLVYFFISEMRVDCSKDMYCQMYTDDLSSPQEV